MFIRGNRNPTNALLNFDGIKAARGSMDGKIDTECVEWVVMKSTSDAG